jgi:mono/diheme cytochrome c family protein
MAGKTGWTIGLVGLAALLVGLPVSAAEVGDAARGATLAKRWCATCHVVAVDQAMASADAPSFAGLASAPGKTAEGLTDFLTLPGTTHSKMPDLHLSRVEIIDIVAYIRTLAK